MPMPALPFLPSFSSPRSLVSRAESDGELQLSNILGGITIVKDDGSLDTAGQSSAQTPGNRNGLEDKVDLGVTEINSKTVLPFLLGAAVVGGLVFVIPKFL